MLVVVVVNVSTDERRNCGGMGKVSRCGSCSTIAVQFSLLLLLLSILDYMEMTNNSETFYAPSNCFTGIFLQFDQHVQACSAMLSAVMQCSTP